MKAGLPLALVLALSACGYTPLRLPGFMTKPAPEATLGDLQPVPMPAAGAVLPAVKLDRLEEFYRQVLSVSDDPATQAQVMHRLADIEMLQAEEELADGLTQEALFSEAIAAYQSLLREESNASDKDRLLYQLSKAYELGGNNKQSMVVLQRLTNEYPQSEHFLESTFRLAETYFAEGDYAAAELAYTQVSTSAQRSVYYQNAVYMQAWSQFKQERYQRAIASFSLTLNLLLPAVTQFGSDELNALPRAQRELAQDSFRVLAVIFSYLDGADAIASTVAQLGYRSYTPMLYRQLGELYLKQQRYRDSAETYRAFSRSWSESDYAHSFQEKVIETYEAGGFGELIIAEKKVYISGYGVNGNYWANSTETTQQGISVRLKLYIEELATHYHALGQSMLDGDANEPSQASAYLMQAGDYYQLFVASFADDARVPHMTFMLAESRWEAGATRPAIESYEAVAYGYPEFPRAADAAYSAIVAYGRLLEDAGSGEAMLEPGAREALTRSRIESQLRYAQIFANDPRAAAVLSNAATELLQLSEYQLAIIASATLTHWQPQPGADIMIPAWLTIAHSHYESGEYAPAEQAYQSALTTMPGSDARRGESVERLGAAIYHQGEAELATANYVKAAEHFSRVIARAPNSSARVQAQYDAAGSYMQANDFVAANQLLEDFRTRFPGHPLSSDVSGKLVNNHQQLQQWQAAAQELDGMLQIEALPERKRQLLYLSAGHYDKAGELELAIHRYRDYAHSWPQPREQRFEAMNRLGELYAETGQELKRQFWLRKMTTTYKADEKPQSDRVVYLAAFASSELAELEFLAYQNLKIRDPLAQTLNNKKAAMQRALKAWKQTNEYGVLQFSTLATYRIGEVYNELSAALLNSQRPQNLDTLALQQYDLLLEEQAYPFEEKAIEIHATNARRSWNGVYDEWVQHSFSALAVLLPVRYSKLESGISFSRDIY